MNADLEQIAQALGGARRTSESSWTAKCPAHDDRKPSLSLTCSNGKILWRCHAGCDQAAVTAALLARGLIGGNGAAAPAKVKVSQARRRDSAGSAGTEWRPIVPAPDDSEPTQENFRHYRHGEPTVAWTYRDGAGRVLFYTARFDLPDSGKEVLPLTYGILKGRKGWHWKAPPEPRPLYRLNQLSDRPRDPVLIVEGEKVVNAADKLFPEYVVMTWQGGCEAVGKADWRPLQDRDVIMWPDADQAGHRAARAVARYIPHPQVVELPPGLPEGWDLADPLPDGLDPRAILENAAKGQPAADDWPEPVLLFAEHQTPAPYPIDALPPIIRDAVLSYQRFGQQPVELVVCSALATVSLACHALANVDRDGNLVGPCSLSFVTVAVSGERKTAVDSRMRRKLSAWQRDRRREQAPTISAAERKLAIWEAKRDGIAQKIKRLAGSTKMEDETERENLESRLLLLEDRPTMPPAVKLFHEDTTPERLAVALAEGWPSASLWSDEAELVIGSHSMSETAAMRFLTLLNRLWDGHEFDRERETRSCAHIRGRRFTVSLMLQPNVLATLLAAGGGIARGVGALARFLLAWPNSTIGTRPYQDGNLDSPALQAFDARLRALLDHPLPLDDEGALEPPALPLSREAFRVWRDFHDEVERELHPKGEFSDLPDFGAKIAEQAARLACVLHIFDRGPTGEITGASMLAGAKIALWHLHEARRVLSMAGRHAGAIDANMLLEWLQDRPAEDQPVTLGEILRLGPYRLRDKARRDAAVALLQEHHIARIEQRGKSEILALNPAVTENFGKPDQ